MDNINLNEPGAYIFIEEIRHESIRLNIHASLSEMITLLVGCCHEDTNFKFAILTAAAFIKKNPEEFNFSNPEEVEVAEILKYIYKLI